MNENGFSMEECHEAYKILIKDLKKKEKFAKMVKNLIQEEIRETIDQF